MFFYDADCGFCVWSLGYLTRFTRDLPTSPGTGLYIQRNAYYIDPTERVYLGHRAIAQALRRHGRSPLVRIAGRVIDTPLFAPVYRIVAWNRHRLGRFVGAQVCRI
ncbi:hypothetical protein J5O04_04130 [Corynebacterium hindlerae]|uniref:hypothetical protein n=1 Tax=Corynebacterium hindlerae TaxID=699041 RepID=UPI001AD75B16|nr:hypothetical protein [Corynebacterium hindlerae]QTH60320.1 hypothetical protein J5O04_04130 [Corynebacterium hindlerae]